MAYFTENNAEGFTPEDLATLNAALDRLAELGIHDDMGRVSDRVNNAWFEGASVEYIVNAVRRHFDQK